MLEKIRTEIDQIDRQMAELYDRRMSLAQQVAASKKGLKPILDEKREAELLADRCAGREFPFSDEFFQKLMELSRRYQLTQNLDKHIVLIGMMGCGKTSKGLKVSELTGYPFVDLDQRIEAEQQRSISEIFAAEGEAYFREMEQRQLMDALFSPLSVISTGGGIVLNEKNMRLIKEKSIVVFIHRSLEEILKTIDYSTRPLSQSKERLEELYRFRLPIYQKYADLEIGNTETVAEGAAAIINGLQKLTL